VVRGVEEREAALALVIAAGVGPVTAGRLRSRYGSYVRAVRAVVSGETPRGLMTSRAASDLACAVASEAWQEELELTRAAGARFVTEKDPGYPSILSEIAAPPVGLFVKGVAPGELTPMVGIVGSRRPTPRGRAIARELASDLAEAGLTIASGLARGIDTAAHGGALEAGGATVAVLGCGLGSVYPPENASLAQSVCASGALVSEFTMRTGAMPGHFPRRNRVIAGLSAGVVVVEAAERSGALITAARALEQGREVLAVPGPVDEPLSVGTNRLIKAGACLVEDAQDVLDTLEQAWGPFGRSAEEPGHREAVGRERGREGAPGAELESSLLSLLSLSPTPVDALIASTRAPAPEVLAALTRLELSGNAERAQGHSFILGSAARRRERRRRD
jgi:DNA processing protein